MFVLTQPQISNNQWSIRCVKSWRSRYQTKAWKDSYHFVWCGSKSTMKVLMTSAVLSYQYFG